MTMPKMRKVARFDEKSCEKFCKQTLKKLVKIMENQKERFWQTPDMTVTKTVIDSKKLSAF